MLKVSLIFFIIATIATVFGFVAPAGLSASIGAMILMLGLSRRIA